MPRVKLFNEEEVLQKAMGLFWKKGYHATSIQDLVDHLGINRASLYDTYGGKDALFQQAFSLYRNQNKKAMIDFLNNYSSVKEGLAKLFEYAIYDSLQDKDSKGCFVVNTTTELASCDQNMLSIIAGNKQEFEAILYNYLNTGLESGEIPANKDIHAIASLLFTLYNGLKVISKLKPDKKEMLRSVSMSLTVLD